MNHRKWEKRSINIRIDTRIRTGERCIERVSDRQREREREEDERRRRKAMLIYDESGRINVE